MIFEIPMVVAAAGPALLAGFLLLTDTRARLVLVVFGAILVFQSSAGLSPAKMAYIGALGIAVVLAIGARLDPLVRTSAGVGIALFALAIASRLSGNQTIWIVRDASNYFLLIAAAPLAAHFGERVSERTIWRVACCAAAAGAYAFSAQWIRNRGLGDLPTPGVPSTTLLGLAVALSSARAVTSARSARWWGLVSLLIVAGLVTGTRSMFLLPVIPLVISFAAAVGSRPGRRRARRALRTAVIAVPVVTALTLAGAQSASIDVGGAFERLSLVSDLGDRGARASLIERESQQDAAWKGFTSNPVLGSGPGTLWEWKTFNGEPRRGVAIDTSVVLLGKWGIVGAAALLVLLRRWWRQLKPRKGETDVWGLAALGLLPFVVGQSVFAPIIEDRGLPLTLLLLGAASYVRRRVAVTGPIDTGKVKELVRS